MFVAKDPKTNQYRPIRPAEQSLIDNLGLTQIVSGMRDGTLDRYNPEGLPRQMLGTKRSGTKCTVCGVVSNSGSYQQHLHVVSGVEGADESDGPPQKVLMPNRCWSPAHVGACLFEVSIGFDV